MVRARCSSQERTPVATPIPPTSSAVSPDERRGRRRRGRGSASTPGWPSDASRTRQPPSAKGWARSSSAKRPRASAPGGRAVAYLVGHEAAGLHQAAAASAASGTMARGPSTAALATLSGSPVDRRRVARSGPRRGAPRRRPAGPAAPPPPGPAPAGNGPGVRRLAQRAGRFEREFTVEGVGAVHRLQLHQRPLARGRHGHGAHDDHLAQPGRRARRSSARLLRHRPVGTRDLQIPAEDPGAVRRQPRLDGGAQACPRPRWRRRRARGRPERSAGPRRRRAAPAWRSANRCAGQKRAWPRARSPVVFVERRCAHAATVPASGHARSQTISPSSIRT